MSTTPTTETLLPCPFCGSKDVKMVVHTNWGWTCFTPVCKDCDARGSMTVKYEDAAYERWNRLHASRTLETRLARLTEIADNLFGAITEDRDALLAPEQDHAAWLRIKRADMELTEALAAYRAFKEEKP